MKRKYKKHRKGESSVINIVIAIIVLLIVALSLIVVSTTNVSDLGGRVKHTIGKVFGEGGDNSNSESGKGAIDKIIDNTMNGFS